MKLVDSTTRFEVREVLYLPARSWVLFAGSILEGRVVPGMEAFVEVNGTVSFSFRVDAIEAIDRVAHDQSWLALVVHDADRGEAQIWSSSCPAGTVIELRRQP